jgi:hypothetical protein
MRGFSLLRGTPASTKIRGTNAKYKQEWLKLFGSYSRFGIGNSRNGNAGTNAQAVIGSFLNSVTWIERSRLPRDWKYRLKLQDTRQIFPNFGPNALFGCRTGMCSSAQKVVAKVATDVWGTFLFYSATETLLNSWKFGLTPFSGRLFFTDVG